jgi:hypothetical protein
VVPTRAFARSLPGRLEQFLDPAEVGIFSATGDLLDEQRDPAATENPALTGQQVSPGQAAAGQPTPPAGYQP